MNRTEKTTVVGRMSEAFAVAPHVILASYQGLTVNQATDLRRRVRLAGGRVLVIKNRLARRAAAGTPLERLSDRFTGPCALATHPSDAIALAKAFAEFVKDNPQLELLAGVVDTTELVDAKGLKQLATLPGLPELRAQLLRVIQAPATTLVRLLGTPGTQLARVVDARRHSQE